MSIVYKALQQAEMENPQIDSIKGDEPFTPELVPATTNENLWLEHTKVVKPVGSDEKRLVTITDPESLATEKFRLLRTRLCHLQNSSSLKKVVITSGAPAEGKTTVAANLAISLARHTSQKVLLLEGDLRHPAVAFKLGLGDLPGLCEWFESQQPLTEFIYQVEGHQLWLLPAGAPAEDALRILQSERFADAVNRLTGCFDWIIIDAPPLAPLADIHFWAQKADGVLLVIRDGVAQKETLARGLAGLDSAKLLGVVHNDTLSAGHNYYQKYERPPEEERGNHKR
jgi:capsular exopolysaccharide synthesis family protein